MKLKNIDKLLVNLLFFAVMLIIYIPVRQDAIQMRGNRAFGGEILLITVLPVIFWPICQTIKDAINDFRSLGSNERDKK